MNRISKQLLKIAREIISSEENSRKFQISGKDKQAKLFITLNSDDWKQVGSSPYWKQITSKFNEECQGNFYGIDHSCFKKKADGTQVGTLTFDGTNTAQHKSPASLIKNNLKQIDFLEEK